MTTYSFTLVIDTDVGDEATINALYDAGCDDATIATSPARSWAHFDREAPTLVEAIVSSIRDVERALEGTTVANVEDELVSVAEIAERFARSRQSINQHVTGERGRGGFPAPEFSHSGRNQVWRWIDVARYFGSVDPDLQDRAAVIDAVNAQLALRRATERAPVEDWNHIQRNLPASRPTAHSSEGRTPKESATPA